MYSCRRVYCYLFVLSLTIGVCITDSKKKEEKPDWAKKDIRDFNDADLERLLEQWEENDDEPLPPDELPGNNETDDRIELKINKYFLHQ